MKRLICLILCVIGTVACTGDVDRMRESFVMESRAAAALSTGARLRLNLYYPQLDRTRGKPPYVRTGYWPQGKYYYDIRPEGDELKELLRIMTQLSIGTGSLKSEPFDGTRAYVSLLLDGHDLYLTGCDIADLKRDIAPQTKAAEALYTLPDADYDKLMELPSIRKMYALRDEYMKEPASFFISEEEEMREQRTASVRKELSEANSASVRLMVHYTQSDAKEQVGLLMGNMRPTYECALFDVDAQEVKQMVKALSRIETMPLREYDAGKNVESVDNKLDNGYIDICLGKVRLPDIERTMIKKSDMKKALRSSGAEDIWWVLPDEDYKILMSLPSIQAAIECRKQH